MNFKNIITLLILMAVPSALDGSIGSTAVQTNDFDAYGGGSGIITQSGSNIAIVDRYSDRNYVDQYNEKDATLNSKGNSVINQNVTNYAAVFDKGYDNQVDQDNVGWAYTHANAINAKIFQIDLNLAFVGQSGGSTNGIVDQDNNQTAYVSEGINNTISQTLINIGSIDGFANQLIQNNTDSAMNDGNNTPIIQDDSNLGWITGSNNSLQQSNVASAVINQTSAGPIIQNKQNLGIIS